VTKLEKSGRWTIIVRMLLSVLLAVAGLRLAFSPSLLASGIFSTC
jgi:hypothetical protein